MVSNTYLGWLICPFIEDSQVRLHKEDGRLSHSVRIFSDLMIQLFLFCSRAASDHNVEESLLLEVAAQTERHIRPALLGK